MMNTPTQPVENASRTLPTSDSIRLGLIVTFLGLVIFVVGAKPEWFGLDHSPVIGFAQVCVFIIGLAVICLGGYIGLTGIWGGEEKSIAADIGLRLVATGYVISAYSGMADVFGMSIRDNPRLPFFGPWQQTGVEIGMVVIVLGMLMVVPWQRLRKR
ncbi:MAG: hypothetical protein WA821_08475 [Anaerolineales bacterium]